MTALLERFPVDQITREAKEIHPGRTILTWIAALLFGLGWVAARDLQGLRVVWLGCAWVFVAARVGWRAAKVSNGPARPD